MQLAYYKFSDKPFELSPDLKFLFLTKSYKEGLEKVLKGINERRGLMILTGEVGTGKTMLIYGVIEQLPPKVKTAFIFHSTYNFIELLQQILSEVGGSVTTEEINELKNQFLLHLKKIREQGEVLAVLIDEAQKLSEDVVRDLFRLFKLEPWVSETLQVVLVGQPELEKTLNSALLKYRSPNTPLRIKIDPLSGKESLDYIEHRLRKVGRSSAGIFSPQALSMIVEKAGGIPRLINVLCDNALFAGYNASVKKIDANIVEEIIRNLEGPDYKPKIKKKPPRNVIYPRLSYRLFVRDGLIVFFGLTLVVGIFQFRTELTERITKFRWFGEIKPLLSKAGDPVKKTPSQKENQENAVQVDLRPEGRPKPAQGTSLGEPVQPSSLPTKGIIQVKKGENLSKLIVNHYGKFNKSLADLLLTHNPSITNPDLVLIDQQIKLPEIREEILITPASDNHFSVHLGTFSDLREANQFVNQLVLKGKNITIQPKKIPPRQTWYRVMVGSFKSQKEALEVIKSLRGKGLLPFFRP